MLVRTAHFTLDNAFLNLSVLLETNTQNAYLVALSSLIKSIPKTSYVHEMPSVRVELRSSSRYYRSPLIHISSCHYSYAAWTSRIMRSGLASSTHSSR